MFLSYTITIHQFWMAAQRAPKNNLSVCFCNFSVLSCGAHGAHTVSGPRALLYNIYFLNPCCIIPCRGVESIVGACVGFDSRFHGV